MWTETIILTDRERLRSRVRSRPTLQHVHLRYRHVPQLQFFVFFSANDKKMPIVSFLIRHYQCLCVGAMRKRIWHVCRNRIRCTRTHRVARSWCCDIDDIDNCRIDIHIIKKKNDTLIKTYAFSRQFSQVPCLFVTARLQLQFDDTKLSSQENKTIHFYRGQTSLLIVSKWIVKTFAIFFLKKKTVYQFTFREQYQQVQHIFKFKSI